MFNNNQEQNELFVGVATGITRNLHAFAGIGLGNAFQDNDGNDYRLSVGIKHVFNLFSQKKKKLKGLYYSGPRI